jgi:hypothetical protein
VRPLDYIEILKDAPTMFFPMIWFETTTELPADLAAQLRLLSIVPLFGNIFGYVGLGLGLVMIASGSLVWFRGRGVTSV